LNWTQILYFSFQAFSIFDYFVHWSCFTIFTLFYKIDLHCRRFPLVPSVLPVPYWLYADPEPGCTLKNKKVFVFNENKSPIFPFLYELHCFLYFLCLIICVWADIFASLLALFRPPGSGSGSRRPSNVDPMRSGSETLTGTYWTEGSDYFCHDQTFNTWLDQDPALFTVNFGHTFPNFKNNYELIMHWTFNM
jgi:hypothetical protein